MEAQMRDGFILVGWSDGSLRVHFRALDPEFIMLSARSVDSVEDADQLDVLPRFYLACARQKPGRVFYLVCREEHLLVEECSRELARSVVEASSGTWNVLVGGLYGYAARQWSSWRPFLDSWERDHGPLILRETAVME